MSERIPSHNGPENFKPSIERPTEHVEKQNNKHEKTPHSHESDAESKKRIENLNLTAQHEAKSGRDMSAEHTVKNQGHSSGHVAVNRELKSIMLKRTLTHIRKRLPASERAFSKFTHSPIVDTVSSAAEKTVARPKGFLGGSIVAFLGSAYTFYMAKQYGFRYNLLLFVLLFAAGYIVTTVLEGFLAILRRR